MAATRSSTRAIVPTDSAQSDGLKPDSSGDRLLAVLDLFTIERPQWTVDAAADKLGVSATTAYRYFKRLTKAGLLTPISGASYALGPAIIQMDRQIQVCDPMLGAARAVMVDLIHYAAEGSIILLCRQFHDRVMCMHQVMGRGPQPPVSYERGRLMPLFRGATSKIILAHLPTRTLKSLFTHEAGEIAVVGLGNNWDEFRSALGALRRAGVCISRGEIDPGRVGIAAPIFDSERAILGSLTFVLPSARVALASEASGQRDHFMSARAGHSPEAGSSARADEALVGRLASLTVAGAREIERAMNSGSAASQPSPARVKIAR